MKTIETIIDGTKRPIYGSIVFSVESALARRYPDAKNITLRYPDGGMSIIVPLKKAERRWKINGQEHLVPTGSNNVRV